MSIDELCMELKRMAEDPRRCKTGDVELLLKAIEHLRKGSIGG